MKKGEIKALYLEMKGVAETKNLSTQQKDFLRNLIYQVNVMTELCIALTKSEIISLIERCTTDVQLEIALRNRKVA